MYCVEIFDGMTILKFSRYQNFSPLSLFMTFFLKKICFPKKIDTCEVSAFLKTLTPGNDAYPCSQITRSTLDFQRRSPILLYWIKVLLKWNWWKYCRSCIIQVFATRNFRSSREIFRFHRLPYKSLSKFCMLWISVIHTLLSFEWFVPSTMK